MRLPGRGTARRWCALIGPFGLALLLLNGCTVGPRYARPAAPAPPQFKELPPNWKAAQPSDQVAKGKWWEIFQDPQLNALEEQINVSNQTLKAAQAQFEQARAAVRINRSFQYPTITGGVSATRNHLSSNRPNGRLAPTNSYTDLQLPVDASYEADVWGRVRNQAKTGADRVEASAGDLAAVALSWYRE